MTLFYRLHRILIGGLFRLYFRIRGEGQEEIPREGPLILAANHSSLLDPIAIGVVCPRQIAAIAKEELWSSWFLRWWLNRMEATPIRRGESDSGSLRAALEVLGHGKALLVFPEGTRSRDGTIGSMKAGVGLLARRSRAPVVPIYVSGTFLALPRNKVFPRPARVRVCFGRALTTEALDRIPSDRGGYEQIVHYVEESIHRMAEKENIKHFASHRDREDLDSGPEASS